MPESLRRLSYVSGLNYGREENPGMQLQEEGPGSDALFTAPAVQTCVYVLFTKTDRRRTYDQKFLKTDADNTHLITRARPLLGAKQTVLDGHRTLKPCENREEVGRITGIVVVIFCFSSAQQAEQRSVSFSLGSHPGEIPTRPPGRRSAEITEHARCRFPTELGRF